MAILYFKIISYCDKWLLCVCVCVSCGLNSVTINWKHCIMIRFTLPATRAIVPRILGQKKVRDETSAHNSLTAAQFLSRYEDVVPYILQQLSTTSANASRQVNEGGKVFVGVWSSGRPKLVLVRFQFRNFGFLQFRCFGRNTYFGQNSLFWPK